MSRYRQKLIGVLTPKSNTLVSYRGLLCPLAIVFQCCESRLCEKMTDGALLDLAVTNGAQLLDFSGYVTLRILLWTSPSLLCYTESGIAEKLNFLVDSAHR